MKHSVILLVGIFAVWWGSVAGQTSKDIEAKYGRRESVYSVGEKLWMTPAYGADGKLCMMRIYPKRVSFDTNYLDDNLDLNEALKFINVFVPIDTRGARKDSFGMSDLGGGVIWTHFGYDHVSFVFISTFKLDKLPERQLDKPDELLDFPIDEGAAAEFRRKQALRSDDDLIREHAFNSKVLEIYWPNRKCVAP